MNNYPPGLSDNTPGAPWNEPTNEEIDVDVFISSTLSKETKITTDDYRKERWEDYDDDDEGGFYHIGGVDYNFDETDFKKEYNNQHLTPLEIIHEFSAFLIKYMPDPVVNMKEYRRFQHLLKECEDWTEDETEVMKN